jgi:DNA-binding NarL/FixJ family response regulator
MSTSNRSDQERLAEVVPKRWRTFLNSGEYAGARASVRANGSELPIDVAARLEFVDDRRLTIHVELAERPSDAANLGSRSVQPLTARERAVVTLIAMGHETQEIAETLYVSPSTVRTHVRNSMAKVGAHTRAQLVALVMDDKVDGGRTHAQDTSSDKTHA